MSDGSTDGLARQLLRAHAARQRFEPLEVAGRRLALGEAYRVQDAFVIGLCGAGDHVAGYKIGLTSPAMQQMCGIASPVHGRILASRVYRSGTTMALADRVRLGLEFEIAVRLGVDVDEVPAREIDIAGFVDAIAPAFELVDDRGADYATLDAASLVADNAWNNGIVVGAWQPPPADLPARAGRVSLDGAPVDEGRVGDALGHPFASVHWLAGMLAADGRRLRAGDVVMTGSIVRTRFPEQPGHWVYEVEGLGAVDLILA